MTQRTREQNIEIIREAAIAANPEIEKPALKKGVLCLVSDDGERYIMSYDVAIHSDYDVLEVIGRPIRLADVLLALSQRKGDENGNVVIDERGRLIHGHWVTNAHYNFRKDDITLQSDEFLQFAADLLAPTQDEEGEIREGV